jgi:chemotaxis protein methyltransferase WspC
MGRRAPNPAAGGARGAISVTAQTEIENLLKRAMGLDAVSIGSSAIERAVQDRLSACKLKDPSAYWEYVRGCELELQELIEAVVVPETWFFRDPEAFAALSAIAQEEWLRAHPEGVLRVLSLPCSTGEEPYSMAMALLDAGFPSERFNIDAVDISTRVIAQAERGIYGRNSFRGKDLGFRSRYFEAVECGYALSETVRRRVRFQHGNMLAAGWLPGVHPYDVIFCRNVLIYFDRPTQDRAVEVLSRLLTRAGLLFVGPSETGLLLDHRFVSSGISLAFAFRKPGAVRKPHGKSDDKLDGGSVESSPERNQRIAPRAPAPGLLRPVLTEAGTLPMQTGIDEAVRLADQGRLGEAEKACEEYLRRHGPSAQLFCLMGMIRSASGNLVDAIQCFRKALYLDRNHHEALVHLALSLEKNGDRAGAQLLRERTQRLEHKSAAT